MNQKNTLFFAFLMCLGASALAQTPNLLPGTLGQTQEFSTGILKKIKAKDVRDTRLGNINGSPYFEENFKKGIIQLNGKPQKEIVYLRYNAFSDEIEMTPHEFQYKTDQAIIKDKEVSCVIEADTYVYLPFINKFSGLPKIGYLIEKYRGDTYNLYLNKTKVYLEATQARTGLERSFPARFTDDLTYYYNKNGNTPRAVKLSKSKLIELFEDTDRAKKYLKENKKSKDGVELWLIGLFSYMDQDS